MNFVIDLRVMIAHFSTDFIGCLIHLEVKDLQLKQLIRVTQVILYFTSVIEPSVLLKSLDQHFEGFG